MLPHVTIARNALVAALTAAAVISAPTAPALAWGDREQGFVAGVATALIVDEILKQSRKSQVSRTVPGFTFVEPETRYVAPRRSTTASLYGTSAARAFESYSLAERKAIQRQLRAWGYYRGGIDGAFGPGTYAAVSAYARDEGISGNLASNSGAFAVYDSLLY